MDIYTIYYINLNNVDNTELFKRLHRIGYDESYISDITFCPYLIIHKDFKTNTIPVYENINEGFLECIKSKCIVIEDTDIDTFIEHSYLFINDNKNNSAIGLF